MEGKPDGQTEGERTEETVGSLWIKIKNQLSGGMEDSQKQKKVKQYETFFRELQKDERVPKDGSKEKLVPLLSWLEKEEAEKYDELVAEQSNKWRVSRKKKAAMKVAGDQRAKLHNMVMAGVAVIISQRIVKKPQRTEKDNEGQNEEQRKIPTASNLYPELPSAPPPYILPQLSNPAPQCQMPVVEVKGGVLALEDTTRESIRNTQRQLESELQRQEIRGPLREREGEKGGIPSSHALNCCCQSCKDNPFQPQKIRQFRKQEAEKNGPWGSDFVSVDWTEKTETGSRTSTPQYCQPPLVDLDPPQFTPQRPYFERQLNLQAPLVETVTGKKYKPFNFTDTNTLVERLPPLAEGGANWLRKLSMLTAGHNLAMGDFRAVMARCSNSWDMLQVEQAAGTDKLDDSESWVEYSTVIGVAMRQKWPLPKNKIQQMSCKMKPNEGPTQFIDRCKEEWTESTGIHPGTDETQQIMFRRAILACVPVKVREKMEDNPDLPGAGNNQWEGHLAHHLGRHQKEEGEKQAEIDDLKNQLTKMQLQEARNKVNDQKKIVKTKQLV